jgi:hypothetical protein
VELSAIGDTMIIFNRDPIADRAEAGQDSRELAIGPDKFPNYRRLVDGLSQLPDSMRLIIDRVRLLELISSDQTTMVVLEPDPETDSVLVRRAHDPGARRLPAVCAGDVHRVAFNPGLPAPALQGSVGPDVLIDAAADHAAVIRSADQGSFTTLVMPVRVADERD